MLEPDVVDGMLTDAQTMRWREEGCVVVDGILPDELVEEAVNGLDGIFEKNLTEIQNGNWGFGSQGKMDFPCETDVFNRITIHPRILGAVKKLLGEDDILLSQSDVWPKYGQEKTVSDQDNFDQRIHMDYGNHTLVHPEAWDKPEAVAMIIYFSDHRIAGGCTAVVPRKPGDPAYHPPFIHMPGVAGTRYVNNRKDAEELMSTRPVSASIRKELYDRELRVAYNPGTILFYRLDVWHRGTAVNTGEMRYVQNILYKRRSADWILNWNRGTSYSMYHDRMITEKLIVGATPEQRSVLGFPKPGAKYWTPLTLRMTEARYAGLGLVLTPYYTAAGITRES